MTATVYSWHADAWMLAQSALKRGAHALLLSGARGLGKRDLALQLSAGYLCDTARARDGRACGACESCRWLAAGTHPDFALVEPIADEAIAEQVSGPAAPGRAKPINVDQIRQLSELLAISAHRGAGKCVVISPAESLNVAASNALLKNLEEPPAGVLFLLVSDRPATLLPTVRSRCQTVPVRLCDIGAAAAWLRENGFDDPELSLALCGGAPLEAATIGTTPAWGRRREFLSSLCTDGADAIAIAETFRDLPPALVLTWLQKWTFDLLLMRVAKRARYNVDLSDAIGRIARGIDPISIARVHRSLLGLQRHVNHPLNPRLFVEQMLIMFRRAATANEARAQ